MKKVKSKGIIQEAIDCQCNSIVFMLADALYKKNCKGKRKFLENNLNIVGTGKTKKELK